MLSNTRIEQARARAVEILTRAGIAHTAAEREQIEVAELGLGEFYRTGILVITYVNTDRYCAKELILLPRQTCPEHRHPPVGDAAGKMETFRCRWGRIWLYVEGPEARHIQARIPAGSEDYYTVFHEIELNPGDQYTLPPDTRHWFQAGEEGAIVSEFSSTSHDEHDIFTDPRIRRIPSGM